MATAGQAVLLYLYVSHSSILESSREHKICPGHHQTSARPCSGAHSILLTKLEHRVTPGNAFKPPESFKPIQKNVICLGEKHKFSFENNCFRSRSRLSFIPIFSVIAYPQL